MSLTIDGKEYELKEAYTIHGSEVEKRWGESYGDDEWYELNVAKSTVEVQKCFVLVEVLENGENDG